MEMPKQKILIVEDSRVISRILQHSIQSRLDLDVLCAHDMNEAKQLIDIHAGQFFLAILDLNLPDAPQGEIVDLILEAAIPPIILTGNLSDDLHDEMIEKPIIDYVIKQNLNEIDYVVSTIARLMANQTRKVLIVDDSKSSRSLISSLLHRHFLTVYQAKDGEEALSVLEEHNDICLVISDYHMPHMNGVELTCRIRQTFSVTELAIIGISTVGAGRVSIEFIKSGASDFIAKPYLHEELYCRVNQNLDSIANYKKLKENTNHDNLTGLYNRDYLFQAGDKLLQNAKRKNLKLTMAIFSIDNFKEINSRYSHSVGDGVLKHVSKLITEQVRDTDVLARIGNSEFCLLSVNMDDDTIEDCYERFQDAIIENPFTVDAYSISTTVSIGYTRQLKDTLFEMINDAKTALPERILEDSNNLSSFQI